MQRGERGNLIHSETPMHVMRAGFLSIMTVNIRFNSAVTTGVIQNEMFCISSIEHFEQLVAVLVGVGWGGVVGGQNLCQIVKGVNMGASKGGRKGAPDSESSLGLGPVVIVWPWRTLCFLGAFVSLSGQRRARRDDL